MVRGWWQESHSVHVSANATSLSWSPTTFGGRSGVSKRRISHAVRHPGFKFGEGIGSADWESAESLRAFGLGWAIRPVGVWHIRAQIPVSRGDRLCGFWSVPRRQLPYLAIQDRERGIPEGWEGSPVAGDQGDQNLRICSGSWASAEQLDLFRGYSGRN